MATIEGCPTVKCCILYTVDHALDFDICSETFLNNNRAMSKNHVEALESQAESISVALGVTVVFIGLNMMI